MAGRPVAEYVEGATLDDVVLSWLGSHDFADDGWEFEALVWPRRGTELASPAKVAGITGAPDQTTIAWAVDEEVGQLTAGLYNLQVNATKDGKTVTMLAHIWVRKGAPTFGIEDLFLDGGTP